MFNQHAKWLKVSSGIPWRHQDPGFIDHVASKKAELVRIYLPPDANTLLSVTDHCLKQHLRDRLLAHRAWITSHGEDMPEILNWRWAT